MAYKINFNDSAYMTAPTLGNLIDGTVKKLRVVSDYIFWGTDDGYWFSQGVATANNREFGVFRQPDDTLKLYTGGQITDITADIPTLFGSPSIDGSLEIEVDFVALTYALTYNGSVLKTGSLTAPTTRTEGALFRLGARGNSDVAGETSGAYLLRAGEQLGNTRVYTDTGAGYVLTRDYVIPSTGLSIPDNASAQNGTIRGTFSDSQYLSYGTMIAPPSNAPSITSASITATDAAVSSDFTFDSGSNTGDPVTGYEVRVDGGVWQSLGVPKPLAFTVSGLTASTVYNTPGLELRAVNSGGASPVSAPETFSTAISAAVAPSNSPVITSPVSVTSSTVSSGFTFNDGANTGSAPGGFEARVNGGAWVDLGLPSLLEFSVGGLTAETSYNAPGVELRAYNAAGGGPVSAAESFTTTVSAPGATVTGDIDAGNLAATSVLSQASDVEPTLSIVARITDTVGSVGWKKFYFRMGNILNKRPLFDVNTSDKHGVSTLSPPWYSYDGVDWTRFDATPIDLGANDYTFQLSTAFTEDTVFISTFPPYPIARDKAFIDEIVASHPALIHRLPSVGDDAEWSGGAVSSQTDERGQTVPAQPMRGYGLWDSTTYPEGNLPKASVVLKGAIHSGEDLGCWGLEGLLRFLIGGTAQASRLLKNFQFFVYPNANPVGRYGGHHRGQWDPVDLTADPNRDFVAFALESTQLLKSMWDQDIPGRSIVYWIDFHSWANTGSGRGSEPVFYVYDDVMPIGYQPEFQSRLSVFGSYDGIENANDELADTGYAARAYNKHAYTFEVKEYESQPTIEQWAMIPGEHFAKVLDAIDLGANADQLGFEGRHISLNMGGDANGAGNCDCEVHESFGRNRLNMQRGLGVDSSGNFRMDANGFSGAQVVLSLSDAEYVSTEQERAFLARVNVEATP